jgi:DME family drug/metabolite transporter
MNEPSSALRGTLLILLAAVLWGTTGTSQALLPEGVASLSIGAVRLAIGSLTLVSFILLTGGFHLTPAWSWKTAFFAGGGSALYQLTFFAGLRLTGVAVGTIVAMGSTPIFAAVLDYFLQKEKLTARWYIATFISLAGGILLVLGGSQELKANPLGILLALVAGFSYAVLALANKRLVASHPAFTVMAVNSTIGAVLISPLLFTTDLSWLGSPRGLGVALHLGVLTTALAYGVFARGLQMVSVHNAATLTLAEPLTAALLGILVIGERLTPFAFGGIVLIFTGLLILTVNIPAGKT